MLGLAFLFALVSSSLAPFVSSFVSVGVSPFFMFFSTVLMLLFSDSVTALRMSRSMALALGLLEMAVSSVQMSDHWGANAAPCTRCANR